MADIKHSIPIAAKPESIYPLIATAKGFSQWWAADVTKPTGTVELGFFKRSTVYRLRLRINSAPTHAEWVCETGDEWNGTRIIFRLEAGSSVTSLRFTHGGWKAETDYFTACNTTWGELMYRLKAAAEGRTPGPLFRVGELAY
ncbi:MAG: SRPBCC domain-containing protein [Terriglobales bacterium]